MESTDLSMSLPSTREAPALARRAMSALSGLDPIRDDATLIVSELVANAVLHSGARIDDVITLKVCRVKGSVTISVRDCGRSGGQPQMRRDTAPGDGGLGLVLVDRLSQCWDTCCDDGCVVWAQMSLS